MNKLLASKPSKVKKLQMLTILIKIKMSINIKKVLYKKSKLWKLNELSNKLSDWKRIKSKAVPN